MDGAVVPVGAEFEPSLARRLPRATAVGRNTSTVSDLRRLVDGTIHAGFPHRIWVTGRVGRTGSDEDGELQFRLLSSTEDEPFWLPCIVPADAVPSVREPLGRVHDADVEDVVTEGRLARVGGLLRYDFVVNRLVLLVSELDPTPTALGLAEERETARERARGAGLAPRQRSRPMKTAPLRVAVVAAPGDAAAAQVRERLLASPYDVELKECAVPLHGVHAPAQVAARVREAALLSDVVLLVRDEGRPLALGVFDSDPVVRAVGDAPVPVLTALGGGEIATVADEVAFLALPTGEAAGDWLLGRLQDAEGTLVGLGEQVEAEARAAAERAWSALDRERSALAPVAEAAGERAEDRERLRARLVLGVAALLVLGLVAAAVLREQPLLLAGVVAVAVAVLTARRWSQWARTRGSGVSGQDDFGRVLDDLRRIRDELSGTSSPEKVHRLRAAAAERLDSGDRLLRRLVGGPRSEQPAPPAPAVAAPVVPAPVVPA
ncbi:MAG: hypothetical protein M3P46_10360, partial [Actinomycetota bacterium]|nr:hypothetical protein [Actinomycetota bacterium]